MDRLGRMMDQGRSFSSHEKKCCFLNTGGERFATISATSGFDFPDDGRALALVDWDQDGYPDFWVSNRSAPRLRFMHNEMPHSNRFLAISLQGNGATSNRNAIGARVEVIAAGLGGKRLVKGLRAGEGFLSQSTRWLTFGLGKLDKIDRVKVRWPDGKEEEFPGLAVDRRYLLVQGTGQAQWVPPVERKLVLQAAEQEAIPYSGISVPLTAYLPMPRGFTYTDFAGNKYPLPVGKGKPLYLVLWASWCEPCQKELADLASHAGELRDAGVDVLALSVDGQGEDNSSPQAAAAFCKERQFPFTVGAAHEDIAPILTGFHHQLVCLTRPLPVPVSFLIDGSGKITTIYKGRVDVKELLADVRRPAAKTLRERWERMACLPGRLIDQDSFDTSLQFAEMGVYHGIANQLAYLGRPPTNRRDMLESSLDYYKLALELQPNYSELREGYGTALSMLGQREEALVQFREAVKLDPKKAILHYYIGNHEALLGRHAEAVPHFRRAIELDPKLEQAQRELKITEETLQRRGGTSR